MKSTLTRILVLLPLLLGLTALAHAKRHGPTADELAQVDFTRPVATLATPERNLAVFRLVRPESTEWAYMVVTVDDDGTKITYGDEATVGRLVKDLAAGLLPAPRGKGRRLANDAGLNLETPGRRDDKRCAKAAGWHFETTGVRVNYCNEGFESARIEHAIALLETTPTAK